MNLGQSKNCRHSEDNSFVQVVVLLVLVAILGIPFSSSIEAAGTVGNGTAGSCTEASFDAAFGGGGSVDFDCGGPATIVFTSTKTVAMDTVLDGQPGIVLSGGFAVRLFTVSGGSLTVRNLTLADGRDSQALPGSPAIWANGEDVIISDSTIRGHLTTEGGCPAINVLAGNLLIERSTIHRNVNQAAANGHPICANNTSTLNVINSTITNNTGGAMFVSGVATVTHSTIAENRSTGSGNSGGPVAFSDGSITLINTLIANNEGDGQCDDPAGGSLVDGGGNLQFPDMDCGGTIPVADPALGPLQDNGGPTQTMAIAFPSPAVDAAQQADCEATDQRGVLPTDGDANGTVFCDIGAFEAPEAALTAIPTAGAHGKAAMVALLLLVGFFVVGKPR